MIIGPLAQSIGPAISGEDAVYIAAMRELDVPTFMVVMREMAHTAGRPVTYLKDLNDRCPWIAETIGLEENKSVYWKYKSDRGRLNEAITWDPETIHAAQEFIANFFKES